LVEGEAQLVSGFNVEYFGAVFALIFIAEYGINNFFELFSLFNNAVLSFSFLRL